MKMNSVLLNMSKIELNSFFSLKLMGLSAISFVALYAQFSVNQTRVGIISRGSLPLTPLPN